MKVTKKNNRGKRRIERRETSVGGLGQSKYSGLIEAVAQSGEVYRIEREGESHGETIDVSAERRGFLAYGYVAIQYKATEWIRGQWLRRVPPYLRAYE